MGAIVIRTRYDEGAESAEVATSDIIHALYCIVFIFTIKDKWNHTNVKKDNSANIKVTTMVGKT
jgi:hypothetical protein